MIPDIIGQSASRFDQRFFLTALVPTAVFAPATAAVVLQATGKLQSIAAWYAAQSAVSQVLAWLGVASVVWFLATLLASQWANVVRLYEGYPLLRIFAFLHSITRGRLSRAWGVSAHLRRRQRLADKAERARAVTGLEESGKDYPYDPEPLGELYDHYPPQSHRVLPTALGNIIRASEDYGHHRYGFDTIHLWPRLAAVLPGTYVTDVERAIIEYQTPLMVSFGSAILAVGSLFLMRSTVSTLTFMLILLGSATLSWVAYRLSFRAAKEYGDYLRTAIDLYRKDLLERWWPELLVIDDDRRRLEALRHFVMTGKKHHIVSASRTDSVKGLTTFVVNDRRIDDTAGEDADVDIPRFGVRLSALIFALVVFLCVAGYFSLERNQSVLMASGDIGAFTDVGTRVKRESIRRGSVARDALLDWIGADGALALRRIADGAVIRQRDVVHQKAPATRRGLVVELARNRLQVRALDLRQNDRVLLGVVIDRIAATACLPRPATSTSSSSTTTSTSSPATPATPPVNSSLDGTVLAILEGRDRERVNVVVQVDVPQTECLGDLTRLQLLRRRT